MHVYRMRHDIPMDTPERQKAKGMSCRMALCTRCVQARGLCYTHYHRMMLKDGIYKSWSDEELRAPINQHRTRFKVINAYVLKSLIGKLEKYAAQWGIADIREAAGDVIRRYMLEREER